MNRLPQVLRGTVELAVLIGFFIAVLRILAAIAPERFG